MRSHTMACVKIDFHRDMTRWAPSRALAYLPLTSLRHRTFVVLQNDGYDAVYRAKCKVNLCHPQRMHVSMQQPVLSRTT